MLVPAFLAQQTSNYVQFLFAKGAINPAASGTNINQKIYYTFGANRQWYQMNNAPKQTFANFSYTIRPPRSYSYWQNIGALVERDQAGIQSNNSFYVSYTIHLLLRKNLVASFGVYAGFRQFLQSPGIIDPNDPVNQKSTYMTYSYPDVIPGLRISGRKFFFDICARQVSIEKQEDFFKHTQIGSPTRLYPTLFMSLGKVYPITDDWSAVPSVASYCTITGIPSINPTLMFYYANRFGLGIATRNISFVSGIFQVRVLENLSIGMCYSYTTSRANVVAPNSYEIMVGVAPMGLGGKPVKKHSIAKCPTLEF
jgi:type IX secretion system PorP/SprF family membrane protein